MITIRNKTWTSLICISIVFSDSWALLQLCTRKIFSWTFVIHIHLDCSDALLSIEIEDNSYNKYSVSKQSRAIIGTPANAI